MSIRAVIFDMDGLMLDTEPSYKIAWQRAAVECGFAISDELYYDLIGRNRGDGERLLSAAFGSGFPLERFHAACLKCEAAVFAESPPPAKPGLYELLALLDLYRMPKAVATSTDRRQASTHLGALDLLNRFDVLATGDEVVNGKPAPDLFVLAAVRLGVEPHECLVLEDSEAGIIAAHRAQMQVYAVPDLKPPAAAVEQLAQGAFDSLAAVEAHLRRRLTGRL